AAGVGESAAPEAELSLAETIPAGAELEVQDTSFGLPSAEEEPTFAVSAEPPAFGDSLDVTADLEPEPEGVRLVDDSVVEDTGASVAIGEPVTAPRPIETPVTPITPVEAVTAEPLVAAETAAPATPADFDALFGNAPISDVTIGGEPETVAAAETGFVADSFVGREPTDELLATAPDIETPPSPFVTETMAELYLQQGFRDEALEVYRQLLAQNPDDVGLAERVKHLEHGTRSSLAIDSVSEEIEAAAKAEEIRLSGSILTVPETPTPIEAGQPPIVEPPTGPAPIIEMIPEPVRPAAPTPVVSTPPVPAGPTVRELFSRIAARRAVPGGGVAPVATAGVAAEATTPMESAAATFVTPPERDEVAIAPGGAVDRVFGLTGVAAEDEGAALALAAAYGGVPAAPIKGQPTRRGSDEISLDAVFKDEDAALRQAGVQRQSSRLRFDQFFPGSEGGEAPTAPPAPSPDAPSDDIAQFTDWLKGLKQS
ncbi:MAG: hypothetical protein H3C62_14865, partial [Gemmatimonadaceae bacterium]|nr:hypothetical protein [Gemmatimonadaceae bacterium]